MTYANLLKLYPLLADLTREQLVELVYDIGVLDGEQAQLKAFIDRLEQARQRNAN